MWACLGRLCLDRCHVLRKRYDDRPWPARKCDVKGARHEFRNARRVVDLDQRRQKSMQYVADLSPPERLSALARIGENSLTIAWVHHSLTERCASYRYALEHLTGDAAIIVIVIFVRWHLEFGRTGHVENLSVCPRTN